jgi:rsbT co-antagonist protein RsbR
LTPTATRIPELLDKYENELLAEWVELQLAALGGRRLLNEGQLRDASREFLQLARNAAQSGQIDTSRPEWTAARDMLSRLSSERAAQGFSPVETALFVFSLKQPVFRRLEQMYADDVPGLARETWNATLLLDRLGLYTTEAFIRTREETIRRQQEEMLELSTPVVSLWHGILALPLIGTLDSARTQVVMQNLLESIVTNSAAIAIIDITGVPTVDTLVAQHLLKTVAAARLMGADCIISGIRPQIAQTIIHLGVDLTDVITKATLADAFHIALQRTGLTIGKARKAQGSE